MEWYNGTARHRRIRYSSFSVWKYNVCYLQLTSIIVICCRMLPMSMHSSLLPREKSLYLATDGSDRQQAA